jgi:hypothetical protein
VGWGNSTVIERLPTMCKVLGFIPCSTKKEKRREGGKGES